MDIKNFSPSCERNKDVIMQELGLLLSAHRSEHQLSHSQILEIGSYSGQHALHLCQQLPAITWQPSDINENLAHLAYNLNAFNLENCLSPIPLDVAKESDWPTMGFDIIFTANTLHIMSLQHVKALFSNSASSAKAHTKLIIYGPFKYDGEYTSPSNADFEIWLKERDEESGIRDFEQINALANEAGFMFEHDITMPANNQLLVWQKAL